LHSVYELKLVHLDEDFGLKVSAMTVAEIVSAVASNTKRTDKDDVARRGIIFARDQIFGKHKFRLNLLETDLAVTSGTLSVDLPTDFGNLREVRWLLDASSTSAWNIPVKRKEWVIRRYPNPSSINSSYPYVAWLEGSRLKFLPSPTVDGIIRISYDAKPTMTSDDDANSIIGLDEVYVGYATAQVFKSLSLFSEAQSWMGDAAMALQNAIEIDKNDSAEVFQQAQYPACDNDTFVEPYLDPFAGLRRGWWSRGS
jgi:hypothetical protein